MAFIAIEDPRSVFIRVSKTGSTSIIRGALNVVPTAEITRYHLPNSWKNEFCFAFVRNPYDRLVSAWQMFQIYHRERDEWPREKPLTLADVLNIVQDESIDLSGHRFVEKLRRHAIPLTHPFHQLHHANFIGRYEALDDDWRKLCKLLDFPCRPLPHLRKTEVRSHYSTFFDATTKKMADKIYQMDLLRFGYRFESQAVPGRQRKAA